MSAVTLPVPAALGRLERLAVAGGGVFLLASAAGFALDRGQFFRSWLLGFLFWLGVGVGSLGLAMLNQLTGGLWGVVPRRFHEAAARTIPYMALAFLPVLLGAATLYPWAAAGGRRRRDPAGEGRLPEPAVLRRCARSSTSSSGACSATCSAAGRGSRTSAPDAARAGRLRGLSGIGLVLLSRTTTFAAIDWGMSLAPHWFSTMYGVLFIVGWTLTALSFTIVLLARVAGRAAVRRGAAAGHGPRPREAAARLHDAVGLRELLAVPDHLVGQHQRGDAVLPAPAAGRLAGAGDRPAAVPLRAALRAAAVAPAQAQRAGAERRGVADAR